MIEKKTTETGSYLIVRHPTAPERIHSTGEMVGGADHVPVKVRKSFVSGYAGNIKFFGDSDSDMADVSFESNNDSVYLVPTFAENSFEVVDISERRSKIWLKSKMQVAATVGHIGYREVSEDGKGPVWVVPADISQGLYQIGLVGRGGIVKMIVKSEKPLKVSGDWIVAACIPEGGEVTETSNNVWKLSTNCVVWLHRSKTKEINTGLLFGPAANNAVVKEPEDAPAPAAAPAPVPAPVPVPAPAPAPAPVPESAEAISVSTENVISNAISKPLDPITGTEDPKPSLESEVVPTTEPEQLGEKNNKPDINLLGRPSITNLFFGPSAPAELEKTNKAEADEDEDSSSESSFEEESISDTSTDEDD